MAPTLALPPHLLQRSYTRGVIPPSPAIHTRGENYESRREAQRSCHLVSTAETDALRPSLAPEVEQPPDGRRTHADHRLARLHRREAAATDRLQRPSRKPQCTGKPKLPAVHRTHCGDAAGAANFGRAAAPNPAGTPTAAVGSTRYCAGKGGAKLFATTSTDKDTACVRYDGGQEDDGAREAAD